MKKKIVIIGGGASGLMAGIAAASVGADVTILEHMDRVGKKILATGNGRCNMTNLTMRGDCYRSSQKQFPMKVIERFSVWDTLTFFDEIGIVTKSKSGYIYPNSEQASAVLDRLRLEAERLHVKIYCECDIKEIKNPKRKVFHIQTTKGMYSADAVILATGSKASPVTGSDGSGYEWAKKFGHTVIEPLPALVQLRCEGKHYKQLAGIRCEASLRMTIDGKTVISESGELQLTDYGISGIPVFQISRFASVALYRKQKVCVYIDYLPSKNLEETKKFMEQRATHLAKETCENFLTGVLNRKLSLVLLKLAGISGNLVVEQVTKKQWEQLTLVLKKSEAKVTATNSFEQAQICCGGVDTTEVRGETLESRLVPSLYLIGELLDVDGICGGYNLQWAWSTGMIAGRSAGRIK